MAAESVDSANPFCPLSGLTTLCPLAGSNGEGQAASGSASSSSGWHWATGGTHVGAVQAVDWHPSLPALLSSAADRSVHVTHVPSHTLNP